MQILSDEPTTAEILDLSNQFDDANAKLRLQEAFNEIIGETVTALDAAYDDIIFRSTIFQVGQIDSSQNFLTNGRIGREDVIF